MACRIYCRRESIGRYSILLFFTLTFWISTIERIYSFRFGIRILYSLLQDALHSSSLMRILYTHNLRIIVTRDTRMQINVVREDISPLFFFSFIQRRNFSCNRIAEWKKNYGHYHPMKENRKGKLFLHFFLVKTQKITTNLSEVISSPGIKAWTI